MEKQQNSSSSAHDNNNNTSKSKSKATSSRAAPPADEPSAASNGTTGGGTNAASGRAYTEDNVQIVKKILSAKEGGLGAHYRVLGIPQNATEADIKKAYRYVLEQGKEEGAHSLLLLVATPQFHSIPFHASMMYYYLQKAGLETAPR
jgi:hypothetical protein